MTRAAIDEVAAQLLAIIEGEPDDELAADKMMPVWFRSPKGGTRAAFLIMLPFAREGLAARRKALEACDGS